MSNTATPVRSESIRPVDSPGEAEALLKHLTEVMEALLGTVEEETELVRTGKLYEASKLGPAKTELSLMYIADTTRIKASRSYLARTIPAMVDDLRKRHDVFKALLQINLTVLATAHAVSESIMRGVSHELARKATPHGYDATGEAAAPLPSSWQPLTVSRVL
jgi:hypothetical protein